MKGNDEIRSESLKRAFNRKWFWRILLVMSLVGLVSNLANGLVEYAYSEMEIQTWADHLVAKAQAMREGMEYAVPSSIVARQMSIATAFKYFIALIFGCIAIFGITSVVLKAAKEEESGWCRDSMGGFARPLGLAWLGLVLFVRVLAWSLLLIVPGVVATYRYSQCWNLKVEHPDWGAAKCLAESCRMMEGRKMQRFRLDLFFFGIAAPFIVSMLVIMPAQDSLLYLLFIFGFAMLNIWMSVARAVFYRELKSASAAANQSYAA